MSIFLHLKCQEEILINLNPVVYFLLIDCKLRVISEVARNNCLFNYTLYHLCVKRRSESMHIVCLLTCMIHGCSCSIQLEYYSMTGLAANIIIHVALASCSNQVLSRVGIATQKPFTPLNIFYHNMTSTMWI